MTNVSVNVAQATAANAALAPASDSADMSAFFTDAKIWMQTIGKWGDESGPTRFMTTYTDKLQTASGDLTKVKQSLEDFVAAMDNVVKTFKNTDKDSATSLKVVAAKKKSAPTASMSSATTQVVVARGTDPTGVTGQQVFNGYANQNPSTSTTGTSTTGSTTTGSTTTGSTTGTGYKSNK